MIETLYTGTKGEKYFQKSRVFLYPILETKTKGAVTPIQTFVSWEGRFAPADRRLMCTFYLRDDVDFKNFEKGLLFGNPLFEDFKEAPNGVGIYIFNFDKFAVDWDTFLKGKYSNFKSEAKTRISNYYNNNNANSVYVDSFVNPKKYYEIYSELLRVPVNVLKGGELCDKPDFNKERLKMEIKDVEVSDKSLDLLNSKTNTK